MSRARPLLTILHPAAFAAGYVLLSFANLPTPAMRLWRPLAIAIVGALILSIGLGLLVRNRALGALLATIIVLALSAWWLLLTVTVIALAWIGLVTALRRVRKQARLAWPGWTSAIAWSACSPRCSPWSRSSRPRLPCCSRSS